MHRLPPESFVSLICTTGRLAMSAAVSSFLLAPSGLAQRMLQPQPIPGPVRDAGVYHLATGTWTREGEQENLGAKVLYRNDAFSGFFGVEPCFQVDWTDEGRIPSRTGHPNAKADNYVVQGIEIAYCTQDPGSHSLILRFYECYRSCTDPAGWPLKQQIDLPAGNPGVPGSSAWGATACWLVTLDLKGTTHEFEFSGDCDKYFDGTTGSDRFGWTFELASPLAGGSTGNLGPLLCGDPIGCFAPPAPYGDGTYYQAPAAPYGTGLGTVDRFWLADLPQCGFANGCYWFGGYCPNPFASFWLVLTGDNNDGLDWTKYCATTANSTGAPADISVAGSSAAAGDLTLSSFPVPDQPGIFFHGPNPANAPFGNGIRCVGGQLIRGAVTVAAGNAAGYMYDNSDNKHTLLPFVGLLRHFQHWFRDPMAGGAAFNLSNGIMGIVPP